VNLEAGERIRAERRGDRDATDVSITTSFGPNTLAGFKVHTDEVREERAAVL